MGESLNGLALMCINFLIAELTEVLIWAIKDFRVNKEAKRFLNGFELESIEGLYAEIEIKELLLLHTPVTTCETLYVFLSSTLKYLWELERVGGIIKRFLIKI
jgi:hypothetical protein